MPIDSPSWSDMHDLFRFSLQARQPRLKMREGDVTDCIAAGVATMGDMVLADGARRMRQRFLAGATGEALTEVASDDDVQRHLGVKAIGVVTFARPTATAGAGSIAAGYQLSSQPDPDGKVITIVTTVDAVFGALDTSIDVSAEAVSVGKDGNIAAGAFVMSGGAVFDSSISAFSVDDFVGGDDRQGDDDLKEAVRDRRRTAARATVSAIALGAREAGAQRVAVEVDGAGIINIYVADENGNSNPALVAAVEAAMPGWAGAADLYRVVGGEVFAQPIDFSLTVRAGTSVASIVDAARQSVVTMTRKLVAGQTLYRDAIATAAKDVDRAAILSVRVNVPAADIVPAPTQVIRASLATTTAS